MTNSTALRRPIVRLALSRAELAVSIGVSASSVDAMVAEGALPPPRMWHSRKLWLVSEVEAYLNEWPSEDGRDAWADWESGTAPTRHRSETAGTKQRGSDPMAQWYEKVGFDPATMTNADLARLAQEVGERRLALIPGSPLRAREREALRQLAQAGVGVAVDCNDVKGCGCDTRDRLETRGYLTTRPSVKFPDRIGSYVLTEDGLKAWQALPDLSGH